ncbi:MAG: hypothetical protein HZA54_00180 [Planctomycetes bacterium]|nr:hypothetical protein [Planctomycetota bacterium]
MSDGFPTVEFRLRPDDSSREIDLVFLERLIRSGKAGPDALVRDPIMTHGEWRTLDNLRFFHKNAPAPTPADGAARALLLYWSA